jgi:molecular chaperone GrpE (heat shock protein)
MSEIGAGSASPDLQQPPAAEPDSNEAALAALTRELAEAQSLVSQHRDQLMRAAAELENIRKRRRAGAPLRAGEDRAGTAARPG